MIGHKCLYDPGFNCFKFVDCPYEALKDCLQTSVVAQAIEIESLKHRKMQSTTRVSVKWRRRAQYYRAKSRKLEAWITLKGLEAPGSDELGLEVLDERVHSNGAKTGGELRRAIHTDKGPAHRRDPGKPTLEQTQAPKGSGRICGDTKRRSREEQIVLKNKALSTHDGHPIQLDPRV